MPELNQLSIIYSPPLTEYRRGDWTVFLDGEAPNWVSADERGAWLLRMAAERPVRFSELVSRYGGRFQLDSGKAWVHVHAFVSEAVRHGVLSLTPVERPPYQGRAAHLRLVRLREAWLHTNNSCNLACSHCLVSSSPKGEPGLPTATWRRLIEEVVALGIDRCYITGGEPFVRPDLPELIRLVTQTHGVELIILTNATLFAGPRKALLEGLDRAKVKFQMSLDGSTAEINDAIRGRGSFAAAVAGLREVTGRGFDVTLTTVATGTNLSDLPNLVRLAASSGVRAQHLMWMHRRGRVIEEQNGWFPSTEQLIDAVRTVKQEADRQGIVLDNAASFELRANAPAGVKFDLGNAGWQSLCVYADGQVYPSAAFANHKPLWCGDATNGMTLEQIWRNSPVLQQIREASVTRKRQASRDPLRYLTGGGDVEHSYFFSGDFAGDDPYYPLYHTLLLDAMDVLTARKAALVNKRSGYDAPRIFHAMGDGAVVCGTTELGDNDTEVAFLHSNCVLSFDVEKPRKIVQQFYGQAAEQPQAELCCPTKYDPAEVGHIPQEVLDRFYGCGSPVTAASPQPGETYVDLGSGAGIDCFIAAKHVGPTGSVIGVDMTEQMLAVANDSGAKVVAALGYDVVEFRKGYLEQIPIEDKIADVVTSNCVVNLSPDKPKVLAELWRVLKDHGRAVIADIVSDREVPPRLKVNEQLWGECIVGALTEEQFLAMLEQAGFYGLSVLKKTFWKEIEGFKFYSVTVQGFKFEKTAGCQFIGQRAIYQGPFKAALDEEGHLFPRDVEVEVCTDTAAKLSHAPYAGQFVIIEPSGERQDVVASACCLGGSSGGCC
ncbi:MAG: methyltransferase domain-containing protein [Candidatus Omnitrophica bacterium]|nr:methyltransferase domain-containing protein [Candidatus Omnitrophota bacterium]MBI2104387.1 methyltransferase domain-containing protein [Candidatus Omnitrophota bacterium]